MVLGIFAQQQARQHPQAKNNRAQPAAGDEKRKHHVEGQFVNQRPGRRDRKGEGVQPDEKNGRQSLRGRFRQGCIAADTQRHQRAEYAGIQPVGWKEPDEAALRIIAQPLRASDVAMMGEDDNETRKDEKEIDAEIAALCVVAEQGTAEILWQPHHDRQMKENHRHCRKPASLLQGIELFG